MKFHVNSYFNQMRCNDCVFADRSTKSSNKICWLRIVAYCYSVLWNQKHEYHYTDVIIGTIASQITDLTIVYSTVYSDADQRKHQSSTSLAFVWGIHRRPVNSPHKWPVTRKMFPFDDVIIVQYLGITSDQEAQITDKYIVPSSFFAIVVLS